MTHNRHHGPRTTDHGRRAAYTLIELLVVIAIIIVLMGLMLPAVINVLRVPEDAYEKSQIAQMTVALESFKTNYGFYPPSRLVLRRNGADYNVNDPLELESKTRLMERFGLDANWTNIAWGCPDGTKLDGSQCLVFFLAGPNAAGFTGIRPGDRDRPFAFPRDQLRPGAGGMLFFTDLHGQPYLYFSTGKNGQYPAQRGSDCPLMENGPYYYAPGQYVQAGSFQIIAAGRDGRFGPGGALGSLPPEAHDDLTNFSKSTLGN